MVCTNSRMTLRAIMSVYYPGTCQPSKSDEEIARLLRGGPSEVETWRCLWCERANKPRTLSQPPFISRAQSAPRRVPVPAVGGSSQNAISIDSDEERSTIPAAPVKHVAKPKSVAAPTVHTISDDEPPILQGHRASSTSESPAHQAPHRTAAAPRFILVDDPVEDIIMATPLANTSGQRKAATRALPPRVAEPPRGSARRTNVAEDDEIQEIPSLPKTFKQPRASSRSNGSPPTTPSASRSGSQLRDDTNKSVRPPPAGSMTRPKDPAKDGFDTFQALSSSLPEIPKNLAAPSRSTGTSPPTAPDTVSDSRDYLWDPDWEDTKESITLDFPPIKDWVRHHLSFHSSLISHHDSTYRLARHKQKSSRFHPTTQSQTQKW